MVAVRQFDTGKVIDQIMTVFWREGYVATSIDDLVAATGVKRGSLYHAFGDKERMFLLAFERYVEAVQQPLLESLAQHSLKAGLKHLFDTQVEALSAETAPPGCLMANSLGESPHCTPAIRERITQRLADLESQIYQRLLQAQKEGEIAAGRDIRALARYFASTVRMLPILYRANRDRRFIADVASTALEVL